MCKEYAERIRVTCLKNVCSMHSKKLKKSWLFSALFSMPVLAINGYYFSVFPPGCAVKFVFKLFLIISIVTIIVYVLVQIYWQSSYSQKFLDMDGRKNIIDIKYVYVTNNCFSCGWYSCYYASTSYTSIERKNFKYIVR